MLSIQTPNEVKRSYTCYDASGAVHDPCDDAADNNETVVDSLTDLVWVKTGTVALGWDSVISDNQKWMFLFW